MGDVTLAGLLACGSTHNVRPSQEQNNLFEVAHLNICSTLTVAGAATVKALMQEVNLAVYFRVPFSPIALKNNRNRRVRAIY